MANDIDMWNDLEDCIKKHGEEAQITQEAIADYLEQYPESALIK